MANPLVGTEHVAVQTAAGSVVSDTASNAKAIGLLAQAIPARVNTPLATAGNGVLLAAALIGSVITRTGPTGAFTDTTDTAAAIISALPTEAPINTSWLLTIRNTTPYAQTIAGGVGVTLNSGGSVIPANSAGMFLVQYTGAASITLQPVLVTPTDLGVIAVSTAIVTAGAGTLTAAGIVGGVINRSGPTAAYSDTTDTGPNIIAALPNAEVGQSWELSIVNTVAFAQTLVAGAGVTLSGLSSPIPANATATVLCTYSGAGTVTMQVTAINYNAASGRDPSSAVSQFGGGTGTFGRAGRIYREIDAAAPVNPAGTGTDYVISVFSLPASSFDLLGRGLRVTAKGTLGSNTANKTVKIIVNPATAVVGSAVGAGGITACSTGVISTSGAAGGWQVEAEIEKYGANGSNTQLVTPHGAIGGGTHLGAGGAPQLATATESGAILIAITGNCGTTATDIALYKHDIDAFD